MSQVPYNSYHGRKRHGRSILIGVVTALVVVLAAVLVGYYCGFFNVPGATTAQPTPPAQDAPSAQPTQEPVVVVESAAPSPSPTPAAADLSAYVPAEKPALGLVLTEYDAVSTQAPDRDVLVDMTAVDLTSAVALPDSERYVAAWWKIDPAQSEAALEDCTALAALGFDEIVLAADVPADDGAGLSKLYRDLKAGLTAAGWKGRLGLDLDQALFADKYDDDLIPAVAQSFERLYFRKTLSGGNKNALTQSGFAADGLTIVTVTKSAANLSYAWAVLP